MLTRYVTRYVREDYEKRGWEGRCVRWQLDVDTISEGFHINTLSKKWMSSCHRASNTRNLP